RRNKDFPTGDNDVTCARRLQRRRRDEQPGDRFEDAGDLLDDGAVVVRNDDAEVLGGHAVPFSSRKGKAGNAMLRVCRGANNRTCSVYRDEVEPLVALSACGDAARKARTTPSPLPVP